ncbi:hypothetical protein Tco_0949557 [Tanacetum coccineum]
MSVSLLKTLKELQQELIEEVHEMLNIFESMEQKVDKKSPKENIFETEIDQLLEVSLTREIRDSQSIDFELKLQHQKEKIACDVSWKSGLSTLNDENILLKTQVDFVVQERENIKLEYQKLFNSIKATRTQHQQEVDELFEHVNQNTYAYGDVRSQNQDLLMTISELKDKLKTFEKGKGVNTKFDKSMTSGKLLCVTPLPNNTAIKAKKVSNTKVNADRSKPVTSHSTPKNEQSQKQSVNVITRAIVRRQKSKDNKSKNGVLKNTNDKSSSAHVRKVSSSVSIDSNKRETMNSTVCQSNASVLNTKTVNVVNDGSNIVCVSCGKDVFMLSHEKCVARYALSRDSRIKRALFTTPVAVKSKNLGATSVVAKSRLSVAKTPTTTNKVIQLVLWIVDSGCSKHMTGNLKLLRNFVEKFMGTVCFGNDHFTAITGYGDYVQGNLTICHGDDLLTGSRESNLYTISISELAASSPVCLMSKATSTKS